MAKQTINIGTAPNDGTGDTARDAFDICNDNFTELYEGKLALDGSTEMTGDLVFAEAADQSSTPAAGKGYLWVRSDTPSSLIFTDDAGTDYDLTDITSTPEGTAILSTGETGGTKFLREDGDGTCSWQEVAGGGAFSADAQTQITPTTAIVLDEATGDEVALDLSYTVNKAAGNDTGLLINQTDTASPGTSLLLDLQVGGTSTFTIDNAATPTVRIGSSTTGNLYNGTQNVGFQFSNNYISVSNNSGSFMRLSVGATLSSTSRIGWTVGNPLQTEDTRLYRDAPGTLALRNGVNAQTLRVYSTYTDASNRENLAITGNAITVETAGTGTDDIDLTLTPAGAGNVKFGTHSAISAETVTGYITIKDSSGTTRKLAVVS